MLVAERPRNGSLIPHMSGSIGGIMMGCRQVMADNYLSGPPGNSSIFQLAQSSWRTSGLGKPSQTWNLSRPWMPQKFSPYTSYRNPNLYREPFFRQSPETTSPLEHTADVSPPSFGYTRPGTVHKTECNCSRLNAPGGSVHESISMSAPCRNGSHAPLSSLAQDDAGSPNWMAVNVLLTPHP